MIFPWKIPVWISANLYTRGDKAGHVIDRAQKIPPNLLEPSNKVKETILGRGFAPLAPPAAQVTLVLGPRATTY